MKLKYVWINMGDYSINCCRSLHHQLPISTVNVQCLKLYLNWWSEEWGSIRIRPIHRMPESQYSAVYHTHSLALTICLNTRPFYSSDVFKMFKNDSYYLSACCTEWIRRNNWLLYLKPLKYLCTVLVLYILCYSRYISHPAVTLYKIWIHKM
jgi:hypothetical protein